MTTTLRARSVLVLGLLGVVAACGPATTSQPPGTVAAPMATPLATTLGTASVPASQATASSTPTAWAICPPGPGEVAVLVEARANLFGAGLESPPAPGGGGGGVLPPVIELPSGEARLVTLPCTGGVTDCCSGPPTIGPAGYVGPPTDVESNGGIAGLVLNDRTMFLAGVFIGAAAPAEPAPERLDFTGNIGFERLEPQLGQTFYVGDGVGKSFVAPAGATRLYLGFVDAAGFVGAPGWYGNNTGFLEATVTVATN